MRQKLNATLRICFCIMIFRTILYCHSVVGGVVQKTNVIYGGANVIALTRAF